MYVSYSDKTAITYLSGKFRLKVLYKKVGKIHHVQQGKSGCGPHSGPSLIVVIEVSTNPRLLPFHKHRLDQRRTDEIIFIGRLLVSRKATIFLICMRTHYSSKDCIITMYAGCHYFDHTIVQYFQGPRRNFNNKHVKMQEHVPRSTILPVQYLN